MSLFELHNETGNVWSHLIGALLFVWFTFYVTVYMQAPVSSMKEFDTCPLESECTVNDLILNSERQHLESSAMHSSLNSHAEIFETVESTMRYTLSQIQE